MLRTRRDLIDVVPVSTEPRRVRAPRAPVAPTVLGTRRVELHELVRAGGFRVLGRGGDLLVLRLCDADGHRVLMAVSGQLT